MYMYSPIAGSNAMHLIGRWNEPETHKFISAVLSVIQDDVTFIDIGANVGEMAIDVATLPNIKEVHAFEPLEDCVYAISVSREINRLKTLHIHRRAVSKHVGIVQFRYDASNPSWSGIKGSGAALVEVPVTTIDVEFGNLTGAVVILLDIEGAERDAMLGGRELIQRTSPLIIFEYNSVSRREFNLQQIQEVLGSSYQIFRLRTNDGFLDSNFRETWNCVAVHTKSVFYTAVKARVKAGHGHFSAAVK